MNFLRIKAQLLLLILVSFAVVSLAQSDTLILKDNRRLEGRFIEERDGTVYFEIRRNGMSIRQRFHRDGVEEIQISDRTGPTYCALPIIGAIGNQHEIDKYVTAEHFQVALNEAISLKPDYLVLVIDTPGGEMLHAEQIIKAIQAVRNQIRVVAFVSHRAISAGAMIAMACPVIVMAPGATIGATVPWVEDQNGLPANIEEKFKSNIRAMARAAAQTAGHSPLLAEAMMDTDVELCLIEDGQKRQIVECQASGAGLLFKSRGKILTLTDEEALRFGLSTGTAVTISDVAEVVLGQRWREVDDKPWYRLANAPRAERSRAKIENERILKQAEEESQRQRELMAKRTKAEGLLVEQKMIESKLAEIDARGMAASQAHGRLSAELDQAVWSLYREYVPLENRARTSADPGYWIPQVQASRDRDVRELRERYQLQLVEYQRLADAAKIEAQQLRTRQAEIMKALSVLR